MSLVDCMYPPLSYRGHQADNRAEVPFCWHFFVYYHSRTYSFWRLCTDGEAGSQKASQGCREL